VTSGENKPQDDHQDHHPDYDRDYKVKLDIFEGPMDLLVHLIKKAEVDIYDIPIALITDQFLAYLDWMKSMSIDFAGDFILMAATLTQIKSRTLLPTHSDEEEEDDPRLEIARPLLEFLQIKEAADELLDRSLLGEDTFTRTPVKDDVYLDEDDQFIKVGLFELIDAFQVILKNISADTRVDLTAEKISVRGRINELVDILEKKGSITFSELFEKDRTKGDVVITFLAILEMAKVHLIEIAQHVQSGVIILFYV
jgi:segregation and condensation protein A